MPRESPAGDSTREAERKHGPAPGPKVGGARKSKPKAAPPKGKAKATKPKPKPTKATAKRTKPEPETTPEPATIKVESSAWASLRDRFSPSVQAAVDAALESGFTREDLITLEFAVGLGLQDEISTTKSVKSRALLQNTFMQSRKNLSRLLEKQGLKKKTSPRVKVPEGMRELKPLAAPDQGHEIDARPKEEELPERYK